LTIRFAHLADPHLGAFRDPVLRRLNLEAFVKALRVAGDAGVDFVVIAGDLFDSPLPDMNVVHEASDALWQLRTSGARVYVFHGSHDRSPLESGIMDVLAATRLFELVDASGPGEDGVTPVPVRDGPTGAVIAAVGGMRGGLEREALGRLDATGLMEAIENAPLAIFGYHGSVEGMLPEELAMVETVPVKKLPQGFHYLALGHVHHHMEMTLEGGGLAAYPGPTFGATFTDLADQRPKGLLIVEAREDGNCITEFVPIEAAPVALVDLDAGGRSGTAAREELMKMVEAVGWEAKVVLLRAHGTLAEGRPAEIGIPAARDVILDRGAIAVYVSRAGLRGAEDRRTGEKSDGKGSEEPGSVSKRVLSRAIDGFDTSQHWLTGEEGKALADDLLMVLKQERGTRKVDDHKETILRNGMAVLDPTRHEGGEEP
jgi:exonuclease SbcD